MVGCLWCWVVASDWVLVVLGSGKWLGACGVGQWLGVCGVG